MLKSREIAISLQNGELQGVACHDNHSVSVKLPKVSYSRGIPLLEEPLEDALKELLSELRQGINVLPPKVLFTGYIPSEATRHFIRNSFVNTGGGDLYFMERPMAVSMGHEPDIKEDQKRVYLLWENGVLECAALKGHHIYKTLRIETETVYTVEGYNELQEVQYIEGITEQAFSALDSYLIKLFKEGYPTETPYFWSSAVPASEVMDALLSRVSKFELVDIGSPLQGCLKLLKEIGLKSLRF